MSDRGLPVAPMPHERLRLAHLFASSTPPNERLWVKFHFKTLQGHKHYTNARGRGIVGTDRESYQRDLFGAIERGEFPNWRLLRPDHAGGRRGEDALQPVRPDQGLAARGLPADRGRRARAEPQPRQLFRRDRAGGLLALEHRAGHRFLPRQDAAGADFLLCRRPPPPRWARITRRCRSTRPSAPCTTITRTARCGSSRNDSGNPDAYYEPNSFDGPVRGASSTASRRCAFPATPIATTTATATTITPSPATCSGCSTAEQRHRLFDNIAAAMQGVPLAIVRRQIAHFHKADPEYGLGVARRMGVPIEETVQLRAAE